MMATGWLLTTNGVGHAHIDWIDSRDVKPFFWLNCNQPPG